MPGRNGINAAIAAAVLLLLGILTMPTAAYATIRLTWIAQKTSTDCGRAVLAMLAARRHGNPEKEYQRIPPPADRVGYSISEMKKIGGSVGVRLKELRPSGIVIEGICPPNPKVLAYFADLAGKVRAGHPVVVPVTVSPSAGHYLILTGAAGDTFTAVDPAAPGPRTFTAAQLRVRMCDFNLIALEGLAP